MTDNDVTPMPWGRIVQITAGFGVVLTALFAAALRQERREKQESQRVRWTDKNRWE